MFILFHFFIYTYLELAPYFLFNFTVQSIHFEIIKALCQQVIKESLRMASIVPWFPRMALHDCEIEGLTSIHKIMRNILTANYINIPLISM